MGQFYAKLFHSKCDSHEIDCEIIRTNKRRANNLAYLTVTLAIFTIFKHLIFI